MDRLILEADGRILDKGRVHTQNPLPLLSRLITLAPGFTLVSFFDMVRTHFEFYQLSELLAPLAEIADAAGKGVPKDGGIDRLVFYKTVSMKGFPGNPGLEIYNSLKGEKQGRMIGLKFFQMDSLLEHELCLGALKHIIFGDGQDMFTYETSYSLFELIEGVAWELSFNFNPLQCSIRG